MEASVQSHDQATGMYMTNILEFFRHVKLPIGLFMVYCLAMWLVPFPSALMLIDAQSQSLEFSTIDDRSAFIGFSNHVLVDDMQLETEEHCEAGLLKVLKDVDVSYELLAGNLVVSLDHSEADSIDANFDKTRDSESAATSNNSDRESISESVGTFRTREGVEFALYPGASVSIGPDVACTSDSFDQDNSFQERRSENFVRPVRLPVWGPGRIGAKLAPPSADADPASSYEGQLMEGKVSIFGKYITNPLRLYPAGDFELSSGSQIRTPVGRSAGLYGYALYEPGKAIDGTFSSLSVSVSSVSPYLLLIRDYPHEAGIDESEYSERIEASFFSSLFKDPLLLSLQGLVLVFLAIVQATATIRELIDRDSD